MQFSWLHIEYPYFTIGCLASGYSHDKCKGITFIQQTQFSLPLASSFFSDVSGLRFPSIRASLRLVRSLVFQRPIRTCLLECSPASNSHGPRRGSQPPGCMHHRDALTRSTLRARSTRVNPKGRFKFFGVDFSTGSKRL